MSAFSELFKKENWLVWFKGLLSAIISGCATGVSLVIVKPEVFNFSQGGLKNLITVMIVSGIIGAANYIKNSPLPILLLICCIISMSPTLTFAERLVCSIPSEDIAACEVFVDGILQVDSNNISLCSMDAGPDGPVIRIHTSQGQDYMELLDESIMATYASGEHIFEARVQHRGGWWSNRSNPLNAEKPGTLGNVQVVE